MVEMRPPVLRSARQCGLPAVEQASSLLECIPHAELEEPTRFRCSPCQRTGKLEACPTSTLTTATPRISGPYPRTLRKRSPFAIDRGMSIFIMEKTSLAAPDSPFVRPAPRARQTFGAGDRVHPMAI